MLDRQVLANSKLLKISQDLSLSHAGTVWDGALCQTAYFNKNPQVVEKYIKQKTVLELGSGTGILGLAACMFGPKAIYLTDLPQYLKLIELNMQKNEKILGSRDIRIVPLQWGNQCHLKKVGEIDTIIGSELAYDKGCVEELMKTLIYYKKQNPNLKIMISYQKYRQEGRNIEVQFRNIFGNDAYNLVEWSKMDSDFRDEGIGIIYVQ